MQAKTINLKSNYIQKCLYSEYRQYLKEAVDGGVVISHQTASFRFLSVADAKPICMSYHYANMYKGKMVLRLDDSDPERVFELTEADIRVTLEKIGVYPSEVNRVSDYFDVLTEKLFYLIDGGHAYCDPTDEEELERLNRELQPSAYRNVSAEENRKILKGMLEGKNKHYCIRALMNTDNVNPLLRDPILAVFSDAVHPATGRQHRVYPTSALFTPVLDSLDAVSHVFIAKSSHDSSIQYKWFVSRFKIRRVVTQEYVPLKFMNTPMKEESYRWLINYRHIEGWKDLRLPFVESLLQRGLLVSTITEFMLEQSLNKSVASVTWEKLWALNKKNISSLAFKFTAIKRSSAVIATVVNYELEEQQEDSVNLVPKNSEAGFKPLYRTPQIIIDREELKEINVGDLIYLVRWGAFKVLHLKDSTGKELVRLEYKPDDLDFKNKAKFRWVALDPSKLVKVNLITYGTILDNHKDDETDSWKSALNLASKSEEVYFSEGFLRTLENGTLVHFDRVGYSILQFDEGKSSAGLVCDFIHIPEGRRRASQPACQPMDN